MLKNPMIFLTCVARIDTILSGLKQRKSSIHLSQFIGNLTKQEIMITMHINV